MTTERMNKYVAPPTPQFVLDRRNEMRQNMQHVKGGSNNSSTICGMEVDYFVESISYKKGQITNVTLKKRESSYDKMKAELCPGCFIRLKKGNTIDITVDGKKFKPNM